MANITQFTGGTATNDGRTIGNWVGTETEYTTLAMVSNPDSADYDPTDPNFYPAFTTTLFYVTEG